MTALWIVLGILALLFLLNLIPLGARVRYDAEGLTADAVAGLIHVRIYPRKPAEERTETEKEKEKRRRKEEKKAEKKKKKEKKSLLTREKPPLPEGAKLRELLPFVKLGLHALGDLRKVFTVQNLTLHVVYGGADAGEIARNYGLAWAVSGAAMSLLTRSLRIKKQDVRPELDYGCREPKVTADACVTLTTGRLLVFAVHYGVKALRLLREKKKFEKGGAKA